MGRITACCFLIALVAATVAVALNYDKNETMNWADAAKNPEKPGTLPILTDTCSQIQQ